MSEGVSILEGALGEEEYWPSLGLADKLLGAHLLMGAPRGVL